MLKIVLMLSFGTLPILIFLVKSCYTLICGNARFWCDTRPYDPFDGDVSIHLCNARPLHLNVGLAHCDQNATNMEPLPYTMYTSSINRELLKYCET